METWNQVAQWGVETIKNMQKKVGLADEDRVQAPHPNKVWRRVSFSDGEVEGSTQIEAIKARQGRGVTDTGSFTFRKSSPEPQRSDKGDMQSPVRRSEGTRQMGSVKGRRSSDDATFKRRSLSEEGPGPIGTSRPLSSEASSRAASKSPLASSSQRTLLKKMEVAPERDFPSPPRTRTGKILHTDAYISSLGCATPAARRYPRVEGAMRSSSPVRKS